LLFQASLTNFSKKIVKKLKHKKLVLKILLPFKAGEGKGGRALGRKIWYQQWGRGRLASDVKGLTKVGSFKRRREKAEI